VDQRPCWRRLADQPAHRGDPRCLNLAGDRAQGHGAPRRRSVSDGA
jgi:hypothetical protein